MVICKYVYCENEVPTSNRQGGAMGRRKKFCCFDCYYYDQHPNINPGSLYGKNGQGGKSDPTPRLSFHDRSGWPAKELQYRNADWIVKNWASVMSTSEMDDKRGRGV